MLCHPERSGHTRAMLCHPERSGARARHSILGEGTCPGGESRRALPSGTFLWSGTSTSQQYSRASTTLASFGKPEGAL